MRGDARTLTERRARAERLPICGGSERVVKFGVGCGKPIGSLDELYRCATCNVPMHVGCLRRHFGPGDGPLPTRVEEIAAKLLAQDAAAVSEVEERERQHAEEIQAIVSALPGHPNGRGVLEDER